MISQLETSSHTSRRSLPSSSPKKTKKSSANSEISVYLQLRESKNIFRAVASDLQRGGSASAWRRHGGRERSFAAVEMREKEERERRRRGFKDFK